MSTVENVRWLSEEWTSKLASAIEGMTGEAPTTSWSLLEAGGSSGDAAQNPMWWLQPLDVAQDSVLSVGTPEKTWLDVGTRSLKLAGIEDADRADARSTYVEILQQALSGLAQSISGRLGREVLCEKGRQASAAPEPARTVMVEFGFAAEPLPPLTLGLSRSLIEALSKPAAALPAAARPLANAPTPPAPAAPGSSKTLDLLLEVELPVSISFGRAKLPLKDVVKLSTGSIVELNRTVSEPVEIIVNNCVIARGDVVVIEGNYGVKINQIISRQERLRTLK